MARGGHSPDVAPTIPEVSYVKIDEDVTMQPSLHGMGEVQAKSYGYNDGSTFERPAGYIRHIEPLEGDLETQVEYDMDEQDQEWLDAVNIERKKEQLDKVAYEVFEIVMDRLEKEWFSLTKHLPKNDLALPSEDSTCAICDDSEGENSNAIVFCDGCNLAVHQDCYGVPYIPEGQWLCRKCTVSPENPVSCYLCPNEGGAFKQSDQGIWIHLLCAIWIPETRVSNEVFMEPIIGVDKISKGRWKLKCSICGTKDGACIQCTKQSCFTAFHVTCARKEKLLLPMKSVHGAEPTTLTAFCDRHLSKEQAEIREVALKAEEEQEEDDEYKDAKLLKQARAYDKTYKPGPPLVPQIIVSRILEYLRRTTIRKKPDFVTSMCRYWSLKREARRGAPLLKRLHLEPWTASSGTKMEGDEEKVMKLEQLQHLRRDLQELLEVTQLSGKREKRKLSQAHLLRGVLSQALFPHLEPLREAYRKIVIVDRLDYFKNPINKKDVPSDYFDIVKNPLSWSEIEAKLEGHKYWDIQEFKDDISLVLDNAVLYNKESHTYHRTALRIRGVAQPILAELDKLSSSPNLRLTASAEGEVPPPWTPGAIGDLEPPLEVLELLLSSDALKRESGLELSADPITSLFNMELEKKKPTPPPMSPTPELQDESKQQSTAKRLRNGKVKEDATTREQRLAERRIADAQRRAAQREARRVAEGGHSTNQSMSGTSTPEISANPPRTRGARAALAALEAEATSSSVSAPPKRSRAGRKSASAAASTSTSVPVPSQTPSRRTSGPIPPPGEIPLVEKVNKRDSFNMFEQGWILPVGSRRGNRQAPVEPRPAAPPPRKRIRVDRASSRLSVYSTGASENRTLTPDVGGSSSTPRDDNSMEVDGGSQRPQSRRGGLKRPASSRLQSFSGVTPERVVIPPPKIVHTPDGQVWVEHQDSPAIRREKRRLEKLAAEAAAGAPASSSALLDGEEPPSPMTSTSNEDADMPDGDATESELSDLTEDEGGDEPEEGESRGDGEELKGEPELEVENQQGGETDGPEDEDMHIDSPAPEVEHPDAQRGEPPAAEDVSMQEAGEPEEVGVTPGEVPEAELDSSKPLDLGDESVAQGLGKPNDASEEPQQEPAAAAAEEPDTSTALPEEASGAADAEGDADAAGAIDAKGDAETSMETDAEGDAEADADADADLDASSEVNPSADVEADADADAESDADGEDDVVEEQPAKATRKRSRSRAKPQGKSKAVPKRRQAARASRIRDLGRLKPAPGTLIEPGTLVWGKTATYPWWPAVIVADDDPRIPHKVLSDLQEERKTKKEWHYIIRFYDRNKSWQQLPLDSMRHLGESFELDEDMLASESTMNRWGKQKRKECQKFYGQALSEMESGDEKDKFKTLQ